MKASNLKGNYEENFLDGKIYRDFKLREEEREKDISLVFYKVFIYSFRIILVV